MTNDIVTTLAEEGVNSDSLVWFAWIMAVAVLAPLLSHLTFNRVPAVVFLLIGGMAIGPTGWELADNGPSIHMLSELGLGFLFLLAGFEINPSDLRSRQGRRGWVTWLCCLAASFLGAWVITGFDDPGTSTVLAIAVTSTALGTLMPILKQRGLIGTKLGDAVMVHGAIGELGPVLAIALLLSARSTWASLVILVLFYAIALGIALTPKAVSFLLPWTKRAMQENAGATNQSVIRLVTLVLGTLMAVAAVFELDVVLGAFAAGFIARALVPEDLRELFEFGLNIVGYGVFIPVFFVTSGMKVNLDVVRENPALLAWMLPLILLTRGLPVFLRELSSKAGSGLTTWPERIQLGLYSATGLPIIVAVTSVATESNLLSEKTASLLVAGGALTVLVFPLAASLLPNPPSQSGEAGTADQAQDQAQGDPQDGAQGAAGGVAKRDGQAGAQKRRPRVI